MDKPADAMDTDAASSSRGAEQGGSSRGPSSNLGQALENVRSLISLAHQLIDQGQPSLALQAVVAAMKFQGGENAVFQTLHRARELYRNKLQSHAAADELASLFAECAIAEAQPLNPNQQPQQPPSGGSSPSMLVSAANDTSILAMSGRKQIMLDAFSDGSNFICLQCGGLVSNLRKDEHLAYWCGKH